MPQALKCQISYQDFWHLTPSAILNIEKAYYENKKQERDLMEQIAWLNGNYNLASIGVAFSKKKLKYPENPAIVREKKRTDFTEEEKQRYIKAFFGQLDNMKKNFEICHNKNS